jgi:hypothetical protein
VSVREKLTDEEIRLAGLEALCRELGPAGMARFLQQFETGRGDFTAERGAWVGHSTVAELAQKIRERREQPPLEANAGTADVNEAEQIREEAN